MANSSTNLDLVSPSQLNPGATVNALADAASPAMLYGRRASTTIALTWGYYGGTVLINGTPTQVANGTVALTANTTNYVEADPATGAVSVNQTGFTSGYTPLYSVATGTATVASYTDLRVLGGGSGSGTVKSVNTKTPDGSGAVTLTASDVGADASGAAAAAISAHDAAADPHPQYLTQTEGDARYDASGAAASAVSAHDAASDPHPQYLTQTEGDARYSAAGSGGTVTSVGLSTPGVLYSVSGSPVTGSGTLALSLISQAANVVLAGPASGVSAAPSFRALGIGDLSFTDTDTSLAANSDTRLATQKAVKAYVDNTVTGGAAGVMVFKGTIDCSANPNYPAANAGHVYKVSVAGRLGGASGVVVEVGDTAYCTATASAGNQATVGSSWNVVQENIDGAVTGPASATDSALALFNGTTGKIIKDSAVAISTDGTFASNTDSKVPTEKAIKTYVTSAIASGGSATPGGATTQVQFNDGGVLSGASALTWDKTNNILYVGSAATPGTLTAPAAASSTSAGNALTISSSAGGATSGNGGALTLQSGNAVSGVGGAISITAGNSTASSGLLKGGPITITSGSSGSSRGGDVTIATGGGTDGATVTVKGGDNSGAYVVIAGGSRSSTSAGAGDVTVKGGDGYPFGRGGNLTLNGGDNSAGSAGGAATLRGGDGTANGGSGGALTIRAGNSTRGAVNGSTPPGAVTIQGGNAGGVTNTSAGGAVSITGGQGGGASGVGGTVTIQGGAPQADNGGGVAIVGAAGVGTNKNGGSITLTPGAATGTGTPGNVVLNGTGAALATTAIGGFTCIPTCAGAPTGTPAGVPTGTVPMVFDTTNFKFWIYTGGAWKGVVVS